MALLAPWVAQGKPWARAEMGSMDRPAWTAPMEAAALAEPAAVAEVPARSLEAPVVAVAKAAEALTDSSF